MCCTYAANVNFVLFCIDLKDGKPGAKVPVNNLSAASNDAA